VITTRRSLFAALGLAAIVAAPAAALASTTPTTTTTPHKKKKSHQTAANHKVTKHPAAAPAEPKADTAS
jgi:hypothetical protein